MEYPLIVLLAFAISSRDPDFEEYVKKQDSAYLDWQCHNSGDYKAFIDAKVLQLSRPKNLDTFKRQVFLLALYKVKKEPASNVLCESSKSIASALSDINADTISWQELYDKFKLFDEKKELRQRCVAVVDTKKD